MSKDHKYRKHLERSYLKSISARGKLSCNAQRLGTTSGMQRSERGCVWLGTIEEELA